MFAYCSNNPVNLCDPTGNYSIMKPNAMGRDGGRFYYSFPDDKYSKTTGMINGQALFEHSDESFGWGSYAKNGCGVIALYNAMQLLGMPQALGKIEDDVFLNRGAAAFGLLGVRPLAIDRYFATQNVRCDMYLTFDKFSQNVSEGAILIVLLVNNTQNILDGAHYVTAQYINGEYVIYNIYSDHPDTETQASLYQISKESCYVCGYIIGG